MAIQPTQVSPTSQQSDRGYIVDHIVLHHCATTDFDGVVYMMQSGSREVSANYVVKDNRIAAVVPENMRSWSLSSSLWDGRSITFEIANESIGGDWPISAASHETVARMCADICTRYGIPINRDRILGHREVYSRHGASYATACPGGLNLDWIAARAQQIVNGDDMALTDPIIPETGGGDLNAYIYYTRKDVQEIKNAIKTGGVDIDALAAKIAPLVKAPVIDYAALAKAVNDDAARRLSA